MWWLGCRGGVMVGCWGWKSGEGTEWGIDGDRWTVNFLLGMSLKAQYTQTDYFPNNDGWGGGWMSGWWHENNAGRSQQSI